MDDCRKGGRPQRLMPRHNPAASGGTAVLNAPPAAPAAFQAEVRLPVTPPAQAGGLKRVSFGKIAKKDETTKTTSPVLPADDKSAEIAARILYRTELFDALKGALETDKAELKFLVAPYYFKVNHGRHEVPSSVSVSAAAQFKDFDENGHEVVRKTPGSEALVTFQNRYSMLSDETSLLPVLDRKSVV